MSILIKDFPSNGIINLIQEYYISEMVIGSINLVFLFLGILLETIVIASIMRVQSKTVDNLFVLSLCCADMIYNLYTFPSVMIVICAGGWATGKQGHFFL